jgi:malonyl-CoA decarboxylase
VTLSPVPLFRNWLNGLPAARKRELASATDIRALEGIEVADWHKNQEIREKVRPILMRLCAHYLLNEQKEGRAFDPVASFHLSNGASIERIIENYII